MNFFTNFITTISIFLTPLFSSLGLLNQPQVIIPSVNRSVSVVSQVLDTTMTQSNNQRSTISSANGQRFGQGVVSTQVQGMSQYVDSEFGFSFWYPGGWTVTKYDDRENVDSGSVVAGMNTPHYVIKIHNNAMGSNASTDIYLSEETSSSDTVSLVGVGYYPGIDATFPGERYLFDENIQAWKYESFDVVDNVIESLPADLSNKTMGGLPILTTLKRQGQYEFIAIPLNADKFIVSGVGSSQPLPLLKTIVSNVSSSTIPESIIQQVATINAEATALR